MTHFLDHQNGCVLIQNLIDGGHDPHLHQGLDHFGSLDRHALGEIGHRDRSRNVDLPNDRSGRSLEAMAGFRDDHRLARFHLLLDLGLDAQILQAGAILQEFVPLLLLGAPVFLDFGDTRRGRRSARGPGLGGLGLHPRGWLRSGLGCGYGLLGFDLDLGFLSRQFLGL